MIKCAFTTHCWWQYQFYCFPRAHCIKGKVLRSIQKIINEIKIQRAKHDRWEMFTQEFSDWLLFSGQIKMATKMLQTAAGSVFLFDNVPWASHLLDFYDCIKSIGIGMPSAYISKVNWSWYENRWCSFLCVFLFLTFIFEALTVLQHICMRNRWSLFYYLLLWLLKTFNETLQLSSFKIYLCMCADAEKCTITM